MVTVGFTHCKIKKNEKKNLKKAFNVCFQLYFKFDLKKQKIE